MLDTLTNVQTRSRSDQHTSTFNRFLLAALVAILPLENTVPTLGGLSVTWILFGIAAFYTLAGHARTLDKICLHPVFLMAYLLLLVGFTVELLHPYPGYSEWLRMAEMFAGAVLIAALCRDKEALLAALYGYVVAGIVLALLLFATSYGGLKSVTANTFEQASEARKSVIKADPLQDNVNSIAFMAAQGAVVAFALALAASAPKARYSFFAVSALCLLGTSLTLSRGGILNVFVSCFIVLLGFRRQRIRALAMAIAVGVVVFALVPDVVLARMVFAPQVYKGNGKLEGRTQVYTAVFEHFPEYAGLGVGAGNFTQAWGKQNGFKYKHTVLGAHNGFFQITIFWGIAGLLALLAVLWQAYRCLASLPRDDVLVICLRGIAVSMLFYMMVSQELYAKEFSIGLGLLVGTQRWMGSGTSMRRT